VKPPKHNSFQVGSNALNFNNWQLEDERQKP